MDKTKKIAEAAKRGFTLVELLVVVAILGILATVATKNIVGNIEKARLTNCQMSVQNIKDACVTYNMNNGRMPKSIDDLIQENSEGESALEGGENAKLDPWDNEYKLEIKGKKVIVISAGPDGEFGNDDDIRSDKIKRQKKSND